jgi:uncharacterized protein (TIGR02145 family)
MKKQKTAINVLLFSSLLIMISWSNATKFSATIKIGTQNWATKNLDVSTFRNGDSIPEAKTNEEWKKSGDEQKAAWCYYNNDLANREKYGKLYNWYAVNDQRGLAPEGWHVPTDAEWTTLTTYLGGEAVAGGKLKETGTSHWTDPNTDATNITGFSGLPGGFRFDVGVFSYIGIGCFWWSSSESGTTTVWDRALINNTGNLSKSNYGSKGSGLSVRCIKNSEETNVLPANSTKNVTDITPNTVKSSGDISFDGGTTINSSNTVRNSNTLNINNPDNSFNKKQIEVDSNLCAKGEKILFGFKVKNSTKRLSICVSDEENYIVYRFGTAKSVEFEFPPKKENSWRNFVYAYYFRPFGTENSGCDLNHLAFENGSYKYDIFDESFAGNANSLVGIIITNKTSEKETRIEGASESIIGTLYRLRHNDKIKKTDSWF